MVLYKYGNEAKQSNMPICSSLFSELQRDILQGRMKPGEKLTEQRICSEYKVSRTPVREALKQLEMEGLIETIPNRGAFVVGFSEQDIRDIYELRKIYEMQAVRWAIERITDDEFDALEETFEFMEFYTMKKDLEKMLNINTGFHQLIYTGAHNRLLEHMLSSYQVYLKLSANPKIYDSDTYLSDVFEEHKAIFDAFKNKDSEAGVRAMEIHMDNSMARRGMK